jgi:hypothetical protein
MRSLATSGKHMRKHCGQVGLAESAKPTLPVFNPKTTPCARGSWPSRLGSRLSRLCQVQNGSKHVLT